MRNITDFEIGYLAALLDVRGVFQINWNAHNRKPKHLIAHLMLHTNKPKLAEYLETFGGISFIRPTGGIRVNFPYPDPTSTLLVKCIPHMKLKQDKAILLHKFIVAESRNVREQIHYEFNQLPKDEFAGGFR